MKLFGLITVELPGQSENYPYLLWPWPRIVLG